MVVYTFIGYPLIIWIVAKFRPRLVRRADFEPDVAIVIVAHNEMQNIEGKLETCLAQDYPKERIRVLVASDGSNDDTNEIVTTYVNLGVQLLAFDQRRGKAACLNDAIESCSEEIIVLTDVRQRLDKDAVRSLVRNFSDPTIGAASGTLEFKTDGTTGFGRGVDAYWRYELFIRRQESCVHSTVGVTGALYALRRRCFRKIPNDTILDDVVIPMNAVVDGYRAVLDEHAFAYDTPSQSRGQEQARKIRTAAGNYQLLASHRSFLHPRKNPILLQFVSHKILRLFAPFCLAGLLLTNILIISYSPLYFWFLVAQAVGYASAFIGLVWPRADRFRVVTVARAFLLLNWFAALGLVEFLRNRATHVWR